MNNRLFFVNKKMFEKLFPNRMVVYQDGKKAVYINTNNKFDIDIKDFLFDDFEKSIEI